ncbi:hypothetical protein SBA3_1920034 [Candidatus Sulfopaludibacter sp. SbA3]|nr:hypothetical protein SBA3_1920034 [Candidatus Sulfopaludibacter sp. SbA3]
MVIASGMLPTKSAEFGKDQEVQQAMADVFGVSADAPLKADVRRAQDRENFYVFWYYIKKNKAGGQALFLPNTHPWLMDFALKLVLPQRDVDFQMPIAPLRRGNEYQGALTYIHKVKDGRDLYFFANSSPASIDTKVVLRGARPLRVWNPHTGEQQPAEFTQGNDVTTVHLLLPPVSSLFYIQE